MRIDLHINFGGNCREAFEFYQSVLGGEVDFFSYGDSPSSQSVPESWRDKIIHGHFKFNSVEIAGADVLEDQYRTPQGFHLLLQLENQLDAKRIFSEFAQEGSVVMDLQTTFWAAMYGIVVDKFGISWELNCSIPE